MEDMQEYLKEKIVEIQKDYESKLDAVDYIKNVKNEVKEKK
jgi:hypothetical protein